MTDPAALATAGDQPPAPHPAEKSELEDLIARLLQYSPDAGTDLVRKAYDFARIHHEGQKRLNGDPYFTHPVATAFILTEVQMDAPSLAAGLLHDVVEDSAVPLEQIVEEFGPEVAQLVDGVTKLKLADFERRESTEGDSATRKRQTEIRRNAENLRKIFLAVAKDLRVMMIKLADRLHNMRTLSALPPERRQKVAEETLQIYAPLAHRLGVWTIKWQLEDLAFKHLEPEKFEEMVEKVDRSRADREGYLKEVEQVLSARLKVAGIDATIQGRPKHLWSIYQKMLKEKVEFSDIYDLSAVRIIVNTVPDCYHALGVVHDLWIPIAERFDDYIARAKPNMYQSLHTKVIGPRGEPLEIQIRTWDMHRTAEFGIAAHWQYKEGGKPKDDFDRKLTWLRQRLFDWQADNKDSTDFLRSVVNDLFTDQVFVFTPAGDVIDLPTGSTPLDFAYRIHSDLGNRCVGAKVNGRIVPLSHKLSNGAIVEVVTRTGASPSLDWLNFVKTSHARSKIKSYFRRLHFAESVTKGREMLERECDRLGVDRAVLKPENLLKLAAQVNKTGEDDLLAAVGFGHLGVSAVMHRLVPPEQRLPSLAVPGRTIREGRVAIEGAEDLMVSRANCCLPIPGDAVVGYITRGRGIVLHREECPNAVNYRATQPERLVPVDWKGETGGRYQTEIVIETLDRMGLLTDISAIFSAANVNIRNAIIKSLPDKQASFELQVEVGNLGHLNQVLTNIGKLSDVLKIHRTGGRSLHKKGQRPS